MEKQYDSLKHEAQARELWQKEKIYKADQNPGATYTVDTPPPTASGSLHIGHVFSYTQTDIIVRYKRMNGFSVVYPFGVDGNGLATERYVEKKHGIRGIDLKRSDFIKICLEESSLMGEDFKNLWQRLGFSIDWELFYSTISPLVTSISQESFLDLYEKGYIYRKAEPALYCPVCRTTVAQAELDDAQKESFFNRIVFKDHHDKELIIGTTRPEMLPACVALFYHPDDERYKHLKGTKALVPLFNFYVPVMENDTVDPDKGSGLVMCCTFGDKTDIVWFKRFNLPYKNIIGPDGKLNGHAGILAGLTISEARIKVIEELVKFDLLRGQEKIVHTVNVHERCKKEIEYTILTQWFIEILKYKKELLAQGDKIEWSPAYMKARYVDWVQNLNWDWCISRQRFYGVPFPVWHCQDCGHIILAQRSQLPVDPQEVAYSGKCPKCDKSNIKADTDVMDTWNTSSLTPYVVYSLAENRESMPIINDPGARKFLPMDMRPQAHDIIRTWAFYTIVKAWMHHETIPWRSIVISGHVLSDSKQKISKSKGGAAITPEFLLTHYPADAIRYWTASGALGQDIAFSESQIQIGQKLITKLWNAFHFVKEHAITCDPAQMPENLGTINEWLLQTASETFLTYQKYFEQNEFSLALDTIEKFFWKNYCDNYLEIVKDQLFNPSFYDEKTVCATRWTLYQVGMRILQMYAPFVPFVTETIYDFIYKERYGALSLHQVRFDRVQEPMTFDKSMKSAKTLIEIVGIVRKLKSDKKLSLKSPLDTMTVLIDTLEMVDAIKANDQLLKGVTHARLIEYKANGAGGTSALHEKDGLWHAIVATEKE